MLWTQEPIGVEVMICRRNEFGFLALEWQIKMTPKVYISIGSAATSAQRRAADTIFRSLETAGLSPRQMERNEWSSEQPLRAIRRVIEQCHGIVVIAFSRYRFPSGIERQKDESEAHLEDVRITTVWNQIEAAMGYARGVPLLVVAERGLLADGLLEGRYDWKVFWTDFSADELESDAFFGYLVSWKQLVLEHSAISVQTSAPELDPSKMSVFRLVTLLTVPQLWGAVSALVALMTVVGSAAFLVGAGKWPWK